MIYSFAEELKVSQGVIVSNPLQSWSLWYSDPVKASLFSKDILSYGQLVQVVLRLDQRNQTVVVGSGKGTAMEPFPERSCPRNNKKTLKRPTSSVEQDEWR